MVIQNNNKNLKASINSTMRLLPLPCCYQQALILEKDDVFYLLLEKCGGVDSLSCSMPLTQGPFTAPLSIKMSINRLKKQDG